jgi:hypothetical protein
LGAVASAVIWLAASGLTSWYAARFPDSNEIYGALGGVVAPNAWVYSILTILLGARPRRNRASNGRVSKGMSAAVTAWLFD